MQDDASVVQRITNWYAEAWRLFWSDPLLWVTVTALLRFLHGVVMGQGFRIIFLSSSNHNIEGSPIVHFARTANAIDLTVYIAICALGWLSIGIAWGGALASVYQSRVRLGDFFQVLNRPFALGASCLLLVLFGESCARLMGELRGLLVPHVEGSAALYWAAMQGVLFIYACFLGLWLFVWPLLLHKKLPTRKTFWFSPKTIYSRRVLWLGLVLFPFVIRACLSGAYLIARSDFLPWDVASYVRINVPYYGQIGPQAILYLFLMPWFILAQAVAFRDTFSDTASIETLDE